MSFVLTEPLLRAVMPRAIPALWLDPLMHAMLAFDIDTAERAAMFLANVAHESVELTRLEESLHYTTTARLRAVFPRYFPNDDVAAEYILEGPEAIANKVYANRNGNGSEASGEGWLYRGRGPVGVTFRSNYAACSQAICGDTKTLLDAPDDLIDPEFGAASAGWYWETARCNESADAGDFDGVCDRINFGRKTIAMGDSNGYADRMQYLVRARNAVLTLGG